MKSPNTSAKPSAEFSTVQVEEMARALHDVQQAANRSAAAFAGIVSALDELESGIVLYDADDKLVLCNRPFREMYAFMSDALAPGTPYADICRTYYQRDYRGDPNVTEEQYVAMRVASHRAFC